MNIKINDYQSSAFDSLKALLQQVYDSDITQELLEAYYVTASRKIIIATSTDTNSVVGCAFLEYRRDYVRPKKSLFITYVAVDPKCRKQGIGRLLFDEIDKRAKDSNCCAIELTSANYREGAHTFYNAIGYSIKKTTVFIKDLDKD